MAHIQCPFRILQTGKLVLGSCDMRYPQRGIGEDAFDDFKTIYDSRSATLNAILKQLRASVSAVTVGGAGYLNIRWGPDFLLEIFPDCSGSVESWRVFTRGGQHYGFPLNSI